MIRAVVADEAAPPRDAVRSPSSNQANALRCRSSSLEIRTPRLARVSERWTSPRNNDQRRSTISRGS
ncbi:MAG: hypothetical protein A2W08_05960 [Candidatus Rokubacteria bacterium RBG_16_73_20]|nr:MAG: hypothetical protein A2W08_05960 [Candidatus Rokubacteria bacterium RBG_16_73_20]